MTSIAYTLDDTLSLVSQINDSSVLILSAFTQPPVSINANLAEPVATVSEVYFIAKASDGVSFRSFGEITRRMVRVVGLDNAEDVRTFARRLDDRSLSYHAVICDVDRTELEKAWRTLEW